MLLFHVCFLSEWRIATEASRFSLVAQIFIKIMSVFVWEVVCRMWHRHMTKKKSLRFFSQILWCIHESWKSFWFTILGRKRINRENKICRTGHFCSTTVLYGNVMSFFLTKVMSFYMFLLCWFLLKHLRCLKGSIQFKKCFIAFKSQQFQLFCCLTCSKKVTHLTTKFYHDASANPESPANKNDSFSIQT